MGTSSEKSILQTIKACFADRIADGALAFGNDAAVLTATRDGARRVLTTDAIQEELDFVIGLGPLESIGWRIISQNVSDLAAMGADPVGFVWSLTVPQRWLVNERDWLLAFCRGASRAAAHYGIDLYGGDLSSSQGLFHCSVTAWGDVVGEPLSRSGAQLHDRICVSRPVGASARGLDILLQARAELSRPQENRDAKEIQTDFDAFFHGRNAFDQAALEAHLWPKAERELGPALVGRASSCMDISDGLGIDLSRLCAASQAGALLRDWTPVSFSASRGPKGMEAEADLGSGEEYSLLFTVAPDVDMARLRTVAPSLCVIGEIVEGQGMYVSDGDERRTLSAQGWDHFSGANADS